MSYRDRCRECSHFVKHNSTCGYSVPYWAGPPQIVDPDSLMTCGTYKPINNVVAIPVNGLELRGAYGRETKMEDWREGKDFKIVGGPYCSNRDVDIMKKAGASILEFTKHDGTLVERIIINDELFDLTSETEGRFIKI